MAYLIRIIRLFTKLWGGYREATGDTMALGLVKGGALGLKGQREGMVNRTHRANRDKDLWLRNADIL